MLQLHLAARLCPTHIGRQDRTATRAHFAPRPFDTIWPPPHTPVSPRALHVTSNPNNTGTNRAPAPLLWVTIPTPPLRSGARPTHCGSFGRDYIGRPRSFARRL